MSVKIMGLVWDADLPRNEKYILLAYADHADHEGESIYPSVSRTAWKTGYEERMVQRITKQLVKSGILVRDGKGKRGTNRYRIDLQKLPTRPMYNPSDNIVGGKMSPLDSLEGAKCHPQNVQNVTPRGGKMSPESSSNHPIKPSIESPIGDNTPPSNSNNHKGNNLPSPNGQQVMDEAFPRPPGYNPTQSHQPITQMDVLIGPRTPIPEPQDRQKIEMVEQDIARSGWDIRSAAIRHIAVYFMAYTPFDIPQSDSTRKGWLKEFKTHKDDFGLIAIPDLYRRATTELFDPDRMDEKGYRPPTGPWGYTKTMHGLKAIERVGQPDTQLIPLQEEEEWRPPYDDNGDIIDIFNPPKGYRL